MKVKEKREPLFAKGELEESVREFKKWTQGKKSKVTVTKLFVPLGAYDVKQARKVLGVTQMKFARMLRVSPETVRKWEQGRNPIEGPAGILIKGLIQKPEVFSAILSQV